MAASRVCCTFRPFTLSLGRTVSVFEARSSFLRSFVQQTAVLGGTEQSNRRWRHTKVPEDRVLPPIKLKRYFFNRLFDFLTTSVTNLEKKVPKPFEVYRTFRSGVTMFIADTRKYYDITTRLWAGESLGRLTRREIELYRQFSSELPVMGLVLLIAFAPGGAFIFPVAYMFPRYLLSSHFWTKEQIESIRLLELKTSLKHYASVLDCMYKDVQHDRDQDLVKKIVNKLDTSVSLSSDDVVSLKPLFKTKFSVDKISFKYRWHLSRSLGLPFRKKKMMKEALLLHFIDRALVREGIFYLPEDELNRACAWRGLNPDGMERTAKVAYLNTWTEITVDLTEADISLLLHLPVLLGNCQPSNRKLLTSRSPTHAQKRQS